MRDIIRSVGAGVSIVMTAILAMGALAYGGITAHNLTGPASFQDQVATPPVIAQVAQRAFAPVHYIKSTAPVITGRPITTSVARAKAVARTYLVRSGDYLSAIAQREYGSVSDWPVIYWANKSQIRYADIIYVGQSLELPALPTHIPAPPAQLAPPAPAPKLVTVRKYQCGDGDGDGYDIPCSELHRGVSNDIETGQGAARPAVASAATYTGSSAMQRCIISRESGGNSQVMNSSGHYGLYQFSYSTWVGSGGNPADFGRASVAEQNQVFYNAVAARGYSDWAPYDGC